MKVDVEEHDSSVEVDGSGPPEAEQELPRFGVRHRVMAALPRLPGAEEGRPSFTTRLRDAMVKPSDEVSGDGAATKVERKNIDELEDDVRSVDDKERLIGLIGAPVAAALAYIVTASLITNDPATHLQGGALNPHHVNVSLYHTVNLVLLGLSVGMLAAAWFRKRLFLGIAMALYGLAIFNLHFWGFGLPFIMAGAWYLVRAYRAQRALREATGEVSGARGRTTGTTKSGRYTPPTSRARRHV
jgi:hypothetical protein